jgi:CRP/FNR family cyclic AMP-dependent transcriptional regulator
MTHLALVTALLGKTELFGSLADADLKAVAEQMREVAYKAGQEIFARGDPGDGIYLVVEGRVRLSVLTVDGRGLSYNHADRGKVFGDIATLDGGARTADATALTHVKTMTLSRARLMRLIETRPSVASAAIALLCSRLRTTSEQAEAIALHPIEVRLARFLLRLCAAYKTDEGRVRINLDMPQAELALLLGASRQRVNAALAQLEEMGAIKRVRSRLECDVAALEKIAGP